ncbi:MAG: glutamate synthase subunit alpha, partial [Deltaproteobacteria bacterium]|nr:glutamate synthase subunit alpha [Deltaproteobacteria bacterium]
FACLLGFGADAVHPYLLLDQLKEYADFAGNDPEKAQYNGIKALNKGLLKTMAKMGISPVASYRGALLFEAVGISKELADRHFGHVTSRVGGINLIDIERDVLFHHENATRPRASLESELLAGGKYQQHRHGEDHAISDPLIRSLQKAVRIGPDKWEGIQEWIKFKSYADAEQSRPRHLRDCLSFKFADSPLDLSQVEPVESILRRFTSGAMSLGSISAVAHETLARAMNRIGGRSNSGEGGEPVERRTDAERKSKIRQVASGRFGVSTHYLATAEEIQIKIAQGAKPGEGGELRGGKVTAFIAATRNTTPGVTLISPPPHHDIYSIEDLKQLIHDLRQVNPKAVISVKLVSAPGVGTVAAGVAKAGADRIIVSGSEGGTGASPLSSVKHAGSPQELGIAEAHQVLIHEGFRPKVSLQTDGQILTGRDAVVAFALGADEVAFSTAPLVSMGCDMMRVCHTGTCPVGIATQDAELIKKFQGEVEQVINYFRLVAEEVRSYLAKLGLKSVDELVGRTELLVQNPPTENSKHGKLDLGPLLHKPASEHLSFEEFRRQSAESDHSRHIARAARPLLERQSGRTVEYDLGEVSNADLAIGSQVSGQISQTYGEFGLPEGAELRVKMHGEAGQSFGAWLAGGVTLELSGVANDYVGKGLSGGCIVVKPQQEASSIAAAPHDHAIAGNTTFYGAIRGKAFLNGKVGERFAIRNSGATLVCEGTGGNACEYMTGGVAVVLGDTGPNPFAGMSGGMAYLLAEDKSKVEKLWQVGQKRSMVVRQIALSDDPVLRQIVEEHAERTGSPRAKTLLSNMEQPVFLQFVPEAITAVKRSEQSDSRTLPVLGSAH